MVQKHDSLEARRRGRPREYDPGEALRRAGEALWITGYGGTSLDEITAATGMNRPNVGAAFGDTHALFLRALREYWDLKFARIREALTGRTIEKTWSRAYEAALSIYFAGEGTARGHSGIRTAIAGATEHPEIRCFVTTGFRTLDAAFEARFRMAREAGALKDRADPEGLALLASATMHTIALRARAGTPRDELQTRAAKAIKAICG
jgi:TetR/AcrR family transcriptional regulator, copper-responsive repressor